MLQANIMISDEGVPLIMDAGLSLIVSRAEFTVAGIYGPCRWQAPEVLDPSEETVENGDCPYTAKSDIYSLGMTILEVLTGNVPFNHRRYDTVVILDIIRGIRPRRPKDMSDDLWKLLGICWDEKPHKRPTANVVEVWLNTVHHFDECSFE
jgi:serine/threonine protein kinase